MKGTKKANCNHMIEKITDIGELLIQKPKLQKEQGTLYGQRERERERERETRH